MTRYFQENRFVNPQSSEEGKGSFKWVDGSTYKGSFLKNVIEGDFGVYTWNDGRVYKGNLIFHPINSLFSFILWLKLSRVSSFMVFKIESLRGENEVKQAHGKITKWMEKGCSTGPMDASTRASTGRTKNTGSGYSAGRTAGFTPGLGSTGSSTGKES